MGELIRDLLAAVGVVTVLAVGTLAAIAAMIALDARAERRAKARADVAGLRADLAAFERGEKP